MAATLHACINKIEKMYLFDGLPLVQLFLQTKAVHMFSLFNIHAR